MAAPGMAMAAGPRSAVLCWLLALALPRSLQCVEPPGSPCREHQYRFQQRCCSDCAPGQRMRSRCTATADTVCSPCQDQHFSPEHHHGFCRSCTVCSARKGSVEVKKCEKTSDRVCMCRAGFMPSGSPWGSVCSPCPEGTFSRGRNENCQPWTNCSSFGKITLRAGSGTEDSICSSSDASGSFSPMPSLGPFPTESLGNSSGPTASSIPSEIPSRDSPSVCLDPSGSAEPSWGSLSLLLLCLLLLVVSGVSILLLIVQAAQKESRRAPGRSSKQKERSCRVPIQEEQLDSNSSLIKT